MQVAAALQEVPAVRARVEADDVVGQHALVDLVANRPRQHAPGVGLRPRDVDEVVQEDVGPRRAHDRRQRVEVVVVDHHDRLVDAVDLARATAAREVLVDDLVAVLEGLDLVLRGCPGALDRSQQVVLDEPQHRVGDDVVEAVVGLGLGRHEPDLVLAAARRLHPNGSPLASCAFAASPSVIADAIQTASRCEARPVSAVTRPPPPRVIRPVVVERHRAAVGDQHEGSVAAATPTYPNRIGAPPDASADDPRRHLVAVGETTWTPPRRAPHAGSSSENVVRPGAVSTSSEPRIRSASSRAIASPRPEPCASSEVKNGSKTRLGGVGGRCPARRRRRRGARRRCARAAVTTTSVPAGVCVSALSIRIRRIWATRSGSQTASIGSPCRAAARARESCLSSAGANSDVTRLARSPRSVASGRSSSEPASSLERSSRSVASLPRRATCSRTTGDELAPRLVVELLVLEQLEEAAEREDRRAQLVRRGRDEAPPRGLDLRELALHVVERARELAELVVAVGREDRREVARRDALGALLEQLHAARDRARHEEAADEREQQPERAGDEDLAADRARRCPARRTAARRRRRRG